MNNSQALTRELTRLYHENGGKLTVSAVIEAARPEDSVLHDQFEWDNDHAADLYRKVQARRLIRNVPIVYQKVEQEVIHVSLQDPEAVKPREGEYRALSVVVQDVDLYQEALDAAAIRLRASVREFEKLLNSGSLNGASEQQLQLLGQAVQHLKNAEHCLTVH